VLNKGFEWNINLVFSTVGYIKLENCGEKTTANYVKKINGIHFNFIYSSSTSISLPSLFSWIFNSL